MTPHVSSDYVSAIPKDEDPDQLREAIGNLTSLEKPVNRGLGSKDF